MVHAIDVSLNVSEAWIINNLKALILNTPIYQLLNTVILFFSGDED